MKAPERTKAMDWTKDLRGTEEGRRLLERERVFIEATENLARLMERRGVTSAGLARRLGVSRARVSHLLSGTRNLTLASLADAFGALGRSMHVGYGPRTGRVAVVEARRSGEIALQGGRSRSPRPSARRNGRHA